mmetsp:Transcript_11312/g.23961  ORF Transcript_11312/g.23961 Transcript_11312/m.23961 type:complete len:251 (+) Transcript_11312:133-885(+)
MDAARLHPTTTNRTYAHTTHTKIQIKSHQTTPRDDISLDVFDTGIEFLDVFRKDDLPLVEETPQLVEVLDGHLDLLLTGTPQVDPLGHQQGVDAPGVFLVGTAPDDLHLLVHGRFHDRVLGQVRSDRGVVLPPGGVPRGGLLRIESLVGQPGPREGVPVGAEVRQSGLDAVVGDRAVGVAEASRLDHELQQVVGRPFQLGRDGRHAVFRRSHQQGEIRVEALQLAVVLQVPVANSDRRGALRASKEPHRR